MPGIASLSNPNRLPTNSLLMALSPVTFFAWPREADDEPILDRITTPRHDDWDRSRGVLRFQRRSRPPRHDQVYLQANQVGRQVREPLGSAVGRSILDHIVLPLDVSSSCSPCRNASRLAGFSATGVPP